jgi:hypothetical protein
VRDRLRSSLRWTVKHKRNYGHLTELRVRSLDRGTCRDMTPEEHALLRALAAASNEDRSTS